MSRVPGTYRRRGNTLLVLPSIPDDAPTALKNGLAIRNECAVDGACPDCGAVGELVPDLDVPLLGHLTFWHEPGCGCLRDDDLLGGAS